MRRSTVGWLRAGRLRTGWLAWLVTVALLLGPSVPGAAAGSSGFVPAADDEPVVVDPPAVEVYRLAAPSVEALLDLIDAGYDVDGIQHGPDGELLFSAVLTIEQLEELERDGFVVVAPGVPLPRVETPPASARSSALAEALPGERVQVLRADVYQASGGTRLYVEAFSSEGASSGVTLTVYDADTGDLIGTMQRFVDAGQYMYHRLNARVDQAPAAVRVVSSLGGEDTMPTEPWPSRRAAFSFDGLQTGFVDHYMDPTELYDRLEALAAAFPHLAEIIELPYRTHGYRRQAMGVTGAVAASAVVWYSKAWGHEGGNDLSVLIAEPAGPDQPLSVTFDEETRTVVVSPATDAAGHITSTADDVIRAVNADDSLPVTAFHYRGNAGLGLIAPEGPVQLSDYLNAPEHVSREPFVVRALRIGKHRDGSKTGVFIYGQEHARERQTPLVVMETAMRLLYNYDTHPDTRKLVDNLDIFIVPSINPDGAHYSFYDSASQRKNLVNHGGPEVSDPARRNSWGVDINRNFRVGSVYDGYSGASTDPLSQTYAGPEELSEPEARNEVWLVENFPNIRFAMNVHSYGDYFMWPPGAYRVPGRIPLERPTFGQESFFWMAAQRIVDAIRQWRGRVVEPMNTGPVIDVLYSAAGNSADDHWYENGVFGWDFEVGNAFIPAESEALEQAMEFANGNMELLRVALEYELDRQQPESWIEVIPLPGTNSTLPGEGFQFPREFRGGGNRTLRFDGPVAIRFHTSEPADVYYTLDGSRPGYDSLRVTQNWIRDQEAEIILTESAVISYFAVDMKGNVEKNYKPEGNGRNYNRLEIIIEQR